MTPFICGVFLGLFIGTMAGFIAAALFQVRREKQFWGKQLNMNKRMGYAEKKT